MNTLDCSALFHGLGVVDPPPILLVDDDELLPGTAGVAVGGDAIFLRRTRVLRGDFMGILLHELTHVLLSRVGARRHGHGLAFLALFQLLLARSGFTPAAVARDAAGVFDNWHPAAPRWLRRRAAVTATAIFDELAARELPADALAAAVLQRARGVGWWEILTVTPAAARLKLLRGAAGVWWVGLAAPAAFFVMVAALRGAGAAWVLQVLTASAAFITICLACETLCDRLADRAYGRLPF